MKNEGLFISLLLSIACSDKDDPSMEVIPKITDENLIGVWHLEPFAVETELRETTSYEFFENSTFEVLNSIEDTSENQVVGYRYRATGNYSLSGNTLTVDRTNIYLNHDVSGFSASVEELGLSTDRWTKSVAVSLSTNGDALTFDYGPCNDTANCVGILTFFRVP